MRPRDLKVSKIIREVRKSLENPRLRNTIESSVRECQAELTDGPAGSKGLASIATELRIVSHFWALHLLASSYDGRQEESGIYGAKMADYSYLKVRILTLLAELGVGRISYPEIHRCFLTMMAFGRWEEALWLGRKIFENPGDYHAKRHGLVTTYLREIDEETVATGGSLVDYAFCDWRETSLCGLVLRLWLAGSGIGSEGIEIPDAGVYAKLLDSSPDDPTWAAAVGEACDYHIERSADSATSGYDVGEFAKEPFNALPIEFWAIRNLKARLGQDFSLPSHPLLDSPFSKGAPSELPHCEDDLLRSIVDAGRRLLPSL